MTKKKIFIDASALADSNCWRKFIWTVKDGLRFKGEENFKMFYGTCGHGALKTFYNGEPDKKAIEYAVDSYSTFIAGLPSFPDNEWRTPDHLYKTLKAYFKVYEGDRDSIKPGSNVFFNDKKGHITEHYVEEFFAYPWFANNEYEFYICGTIDLRGKYHGVNCIIDHKFTARHANYIEEFFDEFSWAVQPMFYSWFVNKLGDEGYPPVLINGIFLKKPTIKSQKLGLWDGAAFKRSQLMTFNDEQMEKFNLWVTNKINILVVLLTKEDAAWLNYDMSSCKKFGMCKYFDICKMPTRELMEIVKQTKYTDDGYNPATHGNMER